uniref:Uncharacterized protein n=1 Tax=Lepeophtheirus salmonis TaxID=72036 RepID=A0A0K2UMF6_LEPSM
MSCAENNATNGDGKVVLPDWKW